MQVHGVHYSFVCKRVPGRTALNDLVARAFDSVDLPSLEMYLTIRVQ